MQLKRTTIRITPELLAKLNYIAAAENRNFGQQILWLIHSCVEAYEAEHGEIKPEETA